jgi:hypothetical protein
MIIRGFTKVTTDLLWHLIIITFFGEVAGKYQSLLLFCAFLSRTGEFKFALLRIDIATVGRVELIFDLM